MASAISDFFIVPGQDITDKTSPERKELVNLTLEQLQTRWASPKGQEILAKWQGSGFARNVLDENVGRFDGHVDIRGIDLSDADLEGTDLSDVDLFGADLSGASLRSTDLSNSYLSETIIRGATFDWAQMTNSLLDGSKYDSDTSFRGVNLNDINFTLAALLQEMAIGQQRIMDLEENHKLFARVLQLTCDYGRSVTRLLLWAAAIILFFALLYASIPSTTSASGFFESIYFSVVTFTTLGYGDIAPVSILGRTLVVIEVILGYLTSGLLVAVLARRAIGQ